MQSMQQEIDSLHKQATQLENNLYIIDKHKK